MALSTDYALRTGGCDGIFLFFEKLNLNFKISLNNFFLVDGRAAAAQREEEKKAATSGKRFVFCFQFSIISHFEHLIFKKKKKNSGSNAESEADTSNKRRKTSVNQKQQSIEKKVGFVCLTTGFVLFMVNCRWPLLSNDIIRCVVLLND